MATFTPIERPVIKNKLEYTLQECHTNVNEHDHWTGPVVYVADEVSTKEEAGVFLRCLQICIEKFNGSRTRYGEPYDSVDFEVEEFEDEFDDIEHDASDNFIRFSKDGKDYFIGYDFDMGMPTEDARYFAGMKFVSAVFYDENGDMFNVEM